MATAPKRDPRADHTDNGPRYETQETIVSRGVLISGLPGGGPLTNEGVDTFAADLIRSLIDGNSIAFGATVTVVDTVEYRTPVGRLGDVIQRPARDEF